MPARSRPVAGFTLIEALVALIIAAMVLGLFLANLRGGLRAIEAAEQSGRALSLARSYLDVAGITAPLRPGSSEGDATMGFRWRQSIALRERRPEGLALYDVRVDIIWEEGGRPRSVGLATMLLATPTGLVP